MAWLSTELYQSPASAPCRSVLMLARELKLELDEKYVDLQKAETKRPWFLRLNPQHTVPTLSDQGYVIWESRAVLQYLCNKNCTAETQHFYPTDPETRGSIDRLLFFDMGTLSVAIKEYFKPRVHEGLPPDAEKENLLKHSLGFLDNMLGQDNEGNPGAPFLCGDQPTIADIAVLASVTELDAMDYSYRCYGDFTRWVERIKERLSSYKEVCPKGVEMTRAQLKAVEEEVKRKAEKERKASAGRK